MIALHPLPHNLKSVAARDSQRPSETPQPPWIYQRSWCGATASLPTWKRCSSHPQRGSGAGAGINLPKYCLNRKLKRTQVRARQKTHTLVSALKDPEAQPGSRLAQRSVLRTRLVPPSLSSAPPSLIALLHPAEPLLPSGEETRGTWSPHLVLGASWPDWDPSPTLPGPGDHHAPDSVFPAASAAFSAPTLRKCVRPKGLAYASPRKLRLGRMVPSGLAAAGLWFRASSTVLSATVEACVLHKIERRILYPAFHRSSPVQSL